MRHASRSRRCARLAALAAAALLAVLIQPVAFDVGPAQAIGPAQEIGFGDMIEVRPGAGFSFEGTDYAVPGLVDALFAADGATLLTLAHGPSGSRIGGLTLPYLTPLPAPLTDLEGTPVTLAVAPDQLNIVVATTAPDALTIVDVETGAVRQTWPLIVAPSAFVIAANGARAYVLSKTAHVVAIIDLTTGDTITQLDAGDNPVDLTIDSTTSTLWVSDDADTPVVHRWALGTLTRTEMPLWGAGAAGDLVIVPGHTMLIALDPETATLYATSTIATYFQKTFVGLLGSGLRGTKLVVSSDQTTLDVLAPSGWVRHNLLDDDLPAIAFGGLKWDTTDLVTPPSAPPRLYRPGITGIYDPSNNYELSVSAGVPAGTSYLWQIEGEAPITTTGPYLSHHFDTAGDIPITVTALRASATNGTRYNGQFFYTVGGAGESTSGGVFIQPITTIDFRTYVASEQVEYWTLPDDTYSVWIKAAGAPGSNGADASGHSDDPDVSQGGAGSAGGASLEVTTSFNVGDNHFVKPGDTIGIVSDGSGGNLLAGGGGDGDTTGGDGGKGGNGSGVFLKTSASTQPWLVVAPGGGGGGGGGGFISIKSRETYGGAGSLDPAATAGHSAQMSGSGDAGSSPGRCAPVGEEANIGPFTADPAQDGGNGSDGFGTSSAGGAGGGGGGCFGGTGGTQAKYQAGPGGGGGTAYSRYPIARSVAWSQAAYVTVTITRYAGAPQGAQFTSPTTQRALVGDESCIKLALSGGQIGPIAISGVDWLTLTQYNEYYYAACGTPGPQNLGTATLHAEATDWNATTDVTINVVDPAITAPDAVVPAGRPVSIPVSLSDFSRPQLTASGLPPGLTYVRSSLDGMTGAIIGTVPYGNDGTWPVALKVQDYSQGDGFHTTTQDITLTVNSHPDLALAIAGEGTVQAGSPLALNATVSNIGSDPSTGTVSVDLGFPTGLGTTSLGGTGWTCVLATGACTHPGGLAPSTALPAIVISATPATADTYTVRGTVDAAMDDDASNDDAEFTVVVSPVPEPPPTTVDPDVPGDGGAGSGTPGSTNGEGSSSGASGDTGGSGPTGEPDSSEGGGSPSGADNSSGSDNSDQSDTTLISAPTTFPWWGWLIIALVLLGGLFGIIIGRRMTNR